MAGPGWFTAWTKIWLINEVLNVRSPSGFDANGSFRIMLAATVIDLLCGRNCTIPDSLMVVWLKAWSPSEILVIQFVVQLSPRYRMNSHSVYLFMNGRFGRTITVAQPSGVAGAIPGQ